MKEQDGKHRQKVEYYSELAAMDVQELAEYLAHLADMEKMLHNRENDVMHEVESLESAMERNSRTRIVAGKVIDEMESTSQKDRLYYALMRSRQDVEEQIEEVIEELVAISREKCKITLLKKCIAKLPKKEQEIVNHICIQGEKWQVYGKMAGLSVSTISRIRGRALELLGDIFNEQLQEARRGMMLKLMDGYSTYEE